MHTPPKPRKSHRPWIPALAVVSLWAAVACEAPERGGEPEAGAGVAPKWMEQASSALEEELVARFGEDQRERARRGLSQVGAFWREDDGSRGDFEEFVGRWGIRRTSPRFWEAVDWIHADARHRNPIEFGLYDFNRYVNP